MIGLFELTARHSGAQLVTLDEHFAHIRRLVPFALTLLPHP